MQTAWFLSDLHIKSDADSKSKILVTFLESLGHTRPATHVFLLGDIFDLWIGSSPFFGEQYSSATKSISKLTQRGIQVFYIEGNHDIHVADFWKPLGVQVSNSVIEYKINGQLLHLCHGDFINPKEKSYHRYITWVRSNYGLRLANAISAEVWWKLGQFLSQASRKRSARRFVQSSDSLADDFFQFAISQSQKTQFDVLIAGHIHKVLDYSWNEGSQPKRAINLGSWFDQPHALCLGPEGLFWETLT